jgi:hypothetical protein
MVYFKFLNEFFNILEKVILNNNGIIYDTYVCDRILASHYTKIYYNKNLPLNRFYDINYDNSTIHRFIKSNIIKFSFKDSLDHINFYSFISNNTKIINNLNIKLEITISSDEPPFKNNNYICYGLLLTNDYENDNEFKYYYSNNTGTPYDNNSLNITSKIITDVINKRTQYIRGFYSNYEIFTDIYKMINNGWIITNLPYIVNVNVNVNVNGNDNGNDNRNGNDNGNDNDKKGLYKIYGNKNYENENGNKKSRNYNRDGFNIIITRYEVILTTGKIFLNNYGVSIKSKSELILDKYLGYYLYYNYKDINIKTLHLFEISIPSLEVQDEIIKYIDNINNTIENLKNEIKELNNQSFYFMKKI